MPKNHGPDSPENLTLILNEMMPLLLADEVTPHDAIFSLGAAYISLLEFIVESMPEISREQHRQYMDEIFQDAVKNGTVEIKIEAVSNDEKLH